MVKKDRSDESYQRPIKKYATPILSDTSSTTLNSRSVFSIRHLACSAAISKASEVRAISICVSLSDYYRKSASEITKVLEFTSINNQSDLVSRRYLLVNYLLPSGSDFINCDRSHERGVRSIYSWLVWCGRKELSLYPGHCYQS